MSNATDWRECDDDRAFAAWLTELMAAFELAYTNRLRELNGKRVASWRADGLHAWSWQWGRIDALEPRWWADVMASAPEHLNIDPQRLRDAAEADALATFTERVLTSARAREEEETTEETEDGLP